MSTTQALHKDMQLKRISVAGSGGSKPPPSKAPPLTKLHGLRQPSLDGLRVKLVRELTVLDPLVVKVKVKAIAEFYATL